MIRNVMLLAALATCLGTQLPAEDITLHLGGSPDNFGYTSLILTKALEAMGHTVHIENHGDQAMTKLESLMESGTIHALILGRTPQRDGRFLPINIGMTNNLMGQRIMFIPKGQQTQWDGVRTLTQFARLGLVAGMGSNWGDVAIWEFNGLGVFKIRGDWKPLYRMVSSGESGVNYLSRGAQEISREWQNYQFLDIEKNLVFVYNRDHILYVSKEFPELHGILTQALERAKESGLIQRTVMEYYPEVFEPPINLHLRRVIPLALPSP